MPNEELVALVKDAAKEGAKEGAIEGSKNIKVKGGSGLSLGSILLLVIMLAVGVFGYKTMTSINQLKDQFAFEKPVEDHDLTLENDGIFGFTVADFEEAILGDNKQVKKLEVYVREVSDVCTLTDAGFAKIKLLSKTQMITYHGIATYTVDLGEIKSGSITMDEENKTITLIIPKPVLEPLNIPENEIEFGDVEKGMLAFGKITLTPEKSSMVQSEARQKMLDKLEKENEMRNAERFAKMSVWEIYQPLILKVSPEYKLVVEIAE